MQVQSVQNNCNNNNCYRPSFKAVIPTKSAQKVIDSMSEAEQKVFNEIVERLADTKFWDMHLSKVKRDENAFWCDFVYKKNPKKVYKLGINPIEARGSRVQIYPMVAESDSDAKILRFSSPERAQALMAMRKRHSEEMSAVNYKTTQLQKVTMWAQQLEFLDEAYRYMKSGEAYPFNIPQGVGLRKPSIIQRLADYFGWGWHK